MLLHLPFFIMYIWSPHAVTFTKHVVHTESVLSGWMMNEWRKEEGRLYTHKWEAVPCATECAALGVLFMALS